MRKIIFLLPALLVITILVYCQAIVNQPLHQIDYVQKSKKQKKTANTLLIAGAVLITSSFVVPKAQLVYDGFCIGVWCDDEYKNDDLKSALIIVGGLSSLSSIPFSIASKKNKKRAKASSFFIDVQRYPAYAASAMVNQFIPLIGFRQRL